jgi:hypothetical protein
MAFWVPGRATCDPSPSQQLGRPVKACEPPNRSGKFADPLCLLPLPLSLSLGVRCCVMWNGMCKCANVRMSASRLDLSALCREDSSVSLASSSIAHGQKQQQQLHRQPRFDSVPSTIPPPLLHCEGSRKPAQPIGFRCGWQRRSTPSCYLIFLPSRSCQFASSDLTLADSGRRFIKITTPIRD